MAEVANPEKPSITAAANFAGSSVRLAPSVNSIVGWAMESTLSISASANPICFMSLVTTPYMYLKVSSTVANCPRELCNVFTKDC